MCYASHDIALKFFFLLLFPSQDESKAEIITAGLSAQLITEIITAGVMWIRQWQDHFSDNKTIYMEIT